MDIDDAVCQSEITHIGAGWFHIKVGNNHCFRIRGRSNAMAKAQQMKQQLISTMQDDQ